MATYWKNYEKMLLITISNSRFCKMTVIENVI